MDRAEIFAIMKTKAVELLEVDPDAVQEDRSFVTDLEVDSLSLVEYTMDLEDTFGIELPEEELVGITTIGAFVDLVQKKVAA